jgi:hypothetical protein
MGLTGVPIYLTTAVMPVILTAMGVTDEIYIFSRYIELLREHPGQVRGAGGNRDGGIMASGGEYGGDHGDRFFIFRPFTLGPVRAFGIFTAVGLLFCMVWSLMVIPALLVLANPARLRSRRGRVGQGWRREDRRCWRGLGAECCATGHGGGSGWIGAGPDSPGNSPAGGAGQLDRWVRSGEMEFYRETRYVNEKFHGAHLLLVCVDAGNLTRTGSLEAADIGSGPTGSRGISYRSRGSWWAPGLRFFHRHARTRETGTVVEFVD